MKNQDWRQRLLDIIENSPKSMRAVSLEAGMGPGYVHSILKVGKDPGIDSLVAICDVVGVSLSKLLYGFDVDPETEELLALIQNNPKARNNLLQVLRDVKSS